jgi:hypothetical protein
MLLDPLPIIDVVKLVLMAARCVCDMIDQTLEQERAEKQALKELRDSIEAVKYDTMVYMELTNAMQNDHGTSGSSFFATFIQRYATITMATQHMLTQANTIEAIARRPWRSLRRPS